MDKKLKQLKAKDLKDIKKEMWEKNNRICPLLGVPLDFDKAVVDHIHKLRDEDPDEQKGTIRDAIEFRSNAMEGKIVNNWRRYFGSDESNHPIDLPTFLRNLADYLEKGAYQCDDGYYYIHPSEAPKEPKVKKSAYNKLVKMYKEKYPKKKIPGYPKSKKMTKPLQKLFEEFDIEDVFYKD